MPCFKYFFVPTQTHDSDLWWACGVCSRGSVASFPMWTLCSAQLDLKRCHPNSAINGTWHSLELYINDLVKSTPFCPTAKTADFDALFLWSCLDGRPSFKTLFLPTNSNGLDNFGPSHWAPERDSKEYWRSFHKKNSGIHFACFFWDLRVNLSALFLSQLSFCLSLSLSLFRNGLFGRWEFGIHTSETRGLDDQNSTVVWTIQLHISPATKKLNALSMILVV